MNERDIPIVTGVLLCSGISSSSESLSSFFFLNSLISLSLLENKRLVGGNRTRYTATPHARYALPDTSLPKRILSYMNTHSGRRLCSYTGCLSISPRNTSADPPHGLFKPGEVQFYATFCPKTEGSYKRGYFQ